MAAAPVSDQLKSLGLRLRAERQRLGMNRADFAALVGAHEKSQGNYERGERAVDVAYLLGLAHHGVDIGYVVTGTRHRVSAVVDHQRFLRMFGDLSARERAAVLAFVTALSGEEEAR